MTRRKNPATTLDALRSLMRETFKMRGLGVCREAAELIRPGTDSWMETQLRLIARIRAAIRKRRALLER